MVKSKLVLLFAVSAFLLISCKQPETIVVTEDPTPASPSAGQQDTLAPKGAGFRQLNIGEHHRIPTLDPLFADNTGALRTIQLIYEGLVRYNAETSLIPAVAKKWSVSSDSLTYRFTLRNDLYYHDSEAFNSGIGRKLVASDIKYVFERMARNNVPGHAARLFMDIEGFEPYYQEQHHVLYPANRRLSGVSGISVPNDTTVIFTLEHRDARFLEKLASPYAVIYPPEAVPEDDVTAFHPVGTGPFEFSQKQGESHYIFAKNQNYYRQGEPVIDRVDVFIETEGAALENALAEGSIHFIPQLGPQMMRSVLNTGGELENTYANRFNLVHAPGTTHHTLNYNPGSSLSRETAGAIARLVDSASFLTNLPGNAIQFRSFAARETAANFSDSDTIRTPYVPDPFARAFLKELSDTLRQSGITLEMLDIQTPVRNTGLYISTGIPLYPTDNTWPETPTGLTGFSTRQYAMFLDSIEHLTFNRFPWWIDLRSVTLPGIDNLGL